MNVNFVQHQNGPERLVIDAEIVFEDGPLAGMKLVGFSLWRPTYVARGKANDDVYVTFPSRAFGVGDHRQYFDYLRSVEGLAADVKRVKDLILTAYHQAHAAGTLPDQIAAAQAKATAAANRAAQVAR